MLSALYNQVDEEVHKLVILSNKSQKHLESLLEVRKFEEQTQQVTSKFFYHLYWGFSLLSLLRWELNPSAIFSFQIKLWFSVEEEKQLIPLESLTLSVGKIKEMRENLHQFLEESVVNNTTNIILNYFLYISFHVYFSDDSQC